MCVGASCGWDTSRPACVNRYEEYVRSLEDGTGRVGGLPFVPEGPKYHHQFIGSDIAAKSIRASNANFNAALNTCPGGKGRRKAVKRLTRFIKGDFERVCPDVPEGATIVRWFGGMAMLRCCLVHIDAWVGVSQITNIPYGYRLQSGEPFSKMYANGCGRQLSSPCMPLTTEFCTYRYRRFGQMLAARPDFKHVFVLSKNPTFRRDTGLKWRQIKTFRNGGLMVELLQLVR